jgi:hypothetical protein
MEFYVDRLVEMGDFDLFGSVQRVGLVEQVQRDDGRDEAVTREGVDGRGDVEDANGGGIGEARMGGDRLGEEKGGLRVAGGDIEEREFWRTGWNEVMRSTRYKVQV